MIISGERNSHSADTVSIDAVNLLYTMLHNRMYCGIECRFTECRNFRSAITIIDLIYNVNSLILQTSYKEGLLHALRLGQQVTCDLAFAFSADACP